MKFIDEFKAFAMRGNVIDLAVGVIIGGAFGKIVSSLVSDIIMPPLGLLIGGLDFKQFSLVLKPAIDANPAVILSYGAFIQNVIDFIIIALAIFLAIKVINKIYQKKEAPPAGPTADQVLLTEIRDILKQQTKSTHKEKSV